MTELLVPKTLAQTAGRTEEVAIPVTDFLVPDEMAWKLVEVNRIDTTSHHVRRWEFIYVVRNDELAVHITDMGPAGAFNAAELEVWGLWEEKWEQLRQDANEVRFANSIGVFFNDRKGEMEKMVDVFLKYKAEQWEMAHNRSHFGPKYSRQRNEFFRRK